MAAPRIGRERLVTSRPAVPTDLRWYRRQVMAALEFGGGIYTFDDLCRGVNAGVMQMWPGVDSIFLTEILAFPQRKILHIFLAGGNLKELEAMAPAVVAFARAQGCQEMQFAGRPGWERTFMRKFGFVAVPMTIMRAKL
jgi:hypothetical protein